MAKLPSSIRNYSHSSVTQKNLQSLPEMRPLHKGLPQMSAPLKTLSQRLQFSQQVHKYLLAVSDNPGAFVPVVADGEFVAVI